MPDGRNRLAHFIQDLPRFGANVTDALVRDFPALGSSDQGLDKWWTLGIARLSASDRYQGVSAAETDQLLTATLVVKIASSKGATPQPFQLSQFKEFLKLRKSREALLSMNDGLVVLSTQASPLFRPVIAQYQQVTLDLLQGHLKTVADRLDAVAKYREMIVKRIASIGDYMNWFEATQIQTSSNAFEGYIKAANEMSLPPERREDSISRYMDSVESDFE